MMMMMMTIILTEKKNKKTALHTVLQRYACVNSQSKRNLLTFCAKFMDLAFCYDVILQ